MRTHALRVRNVLLPGTVLISNGVICPISVFNADPNYLVEFLTP